MAVWAVTKYNWKFKKEGGVLGSFLSSIGYQTQSLALARQMLYIELNPHHLPLCLISHFYLLIPSIKFSLSPVLFVLHVQSECSFS